MAGAARGGHMTERPDPVGRDWPVRNFRRKPPGALYGGAGGGVGHHVRGPPPMLLLVHVGARSGKTWTSGLTYMPYDGSFVVVGSNGGGARSPGWGHQPRGLPHRQVQEGAGENKEPAPEARRRVQPRLSADG